MFTNDDYKSYFAEINQLEKKMLKLQLSTVAKVKNPAIRQVFDLVMEDEVRHVALTEELLTIVKNIK